MTELGVFFSCEERSAAEIGRAARDAEDAGFRSAWISDHFHPWTDAQGESPFVWSVLGALAEATRSMRWMTAVTCPTVRTHPGVVAHAAATTATLMPGRFRLGVGSGEALNEHIFGARWPQADVRLEMLEEAVEVIRLMWQGGFQSHDGRHYTLESARLYSLPDEPPPIFVSGFGPKAIALAGRIADGYVTVGPDADAVRSYREHDGRGPITGGLKVCWGPDREECVRTAHRLWPNEALSGELAQLRPSPRHFEQATELVTEHHISDALPCGSDPEEHAAAIQAYVDEESRCLTVHRPRMSRARRSICARDAPIGCRPAPSPPSACSVCGGADWRATGSALPSHRQADWFDGTTRSHLARHARQVSRDVCA